MYAKMSKCKFRLNEIVFLKHVVFGNVILVDPMKVETIVNWEKPRNVIEI